MGVVLLLLLLLVVVVVVFVVVVIVVAAVDGFGVEFVAVAVAADVAAHLVIRCFCCRCCVAYYCCSRLFLCSCCLAVAATESVVVRGVSERSVTAALRRVRKRAPKMMSHSLEWH